MKIVALPNALGAEVRGLDLGRELPDPVFDALYRGYLDHLLLLLRGQRIDDAALLRLAARFGELMMPPAAHERSGRQVSDAPPEITVVSNVKVGGVAIGELGDGEVVWHSDYSFKQVIGGMRVLHGVRIPPHSAGGSTHFANMYAAFDELPPELRALALEGFIRHDTRYDTNRKLRAGAQAGGEGADAGGPVHPIASTHPETGFNSLFLGRRLAHGIVGMAAEHSDAMLDALWAHATQERFCYEHFWQPGDVVLWDNRCTMHRRGPFDASQARILHAAQVKGHRPFRAVEAARKAAHPRATAPRERTAA